MGNQRKVKAISWVTYNNWPIRQASSWYSRAAVVQFGLFEEDATRGINSIGRTGRKRAYVDG